jgi:hypothetical protein
VRPGADQLVSRSADGFTIGTPTATVLDGRDAMLAVAMNGEPLPPAHGFPVRMLVPGLYGYVSATKWLVDLELTGFDEFDPYWVRRGWARQAPVKTMSRIDTPRPLGRVAAGQVAVAGSHGPSTAGSAGSRSGSTAAPGGRPGWPPSTATTPGASGSGRGRPPAAATPLRSVPATARAPPSRRTGLRRSPTAPPAGTRWWSPSPDRTVRAGRPPGRSREGLPVLSLGRSKDASASSGCSPLALGEALLGLQQHQQHAHQVIERLAGGLPVRIADRSGKERVGLLALLRVIRAGPPSPSPPRSTQVLSDADTDLLATTTWTRLHPAA